MAQSAVSAAGQMPRRTPTTCTMTAYTMRSTIMSKGFKIFLLTSAVLAAVLFALPRVL